MFPLEDFIEQAAQCLTTFKMCSERRKDLGKGFRMVLLFTVLKKIIVFVINGLTNNILTK